MGLDSLLRTLYKKAYAILEAPLSRPSTRERNPYYTSFPWGWFGVAWSDELRPGDVLPLHYFGRELVLWRTADGRPQVADAYCPHLGAHLGRGGRVEGEHLVCPFHGWEWTASGGCARVPYGTRPHPTARLAVWPTIDRNGLVMVWYHPSGEAPSFEVPEIPELGSGAYTEPRKGEWTIATTWQETAENGPDFVHLKYVHHAPAIPVQESYELDGPRCSMRASVTYYSPRGDTVGRIDTDSWGPGFSVARFSGIFDLVMLDWCVPIDFEHLENHKGYFLSKAMGDEKIARVGDAFVKDLKFQMDEDVAIFEHKVWQPRPALVPEDGPIAEFRRWARQFYVDPAAAAR